MYALEMLPTSRLCDIQLDMFLSYKFFESVCSLGLDLDMVGYDHL